MPMSVLHISLTHCVPQLREILVILEFSGMEASILLRDNNNIFNSIGTGGKYNEDGLGEHYREVRDKVSPWADPVVHMSVSEAEKRLKKHLQI